MQEAAVAYLEQVNSDGHDVYRRVTRAALWLESTCNFLKEAQAKVQVADRRRSRERQLTKRKKKKWKRPLIILVGGIQGELFSIYLLWVENHLSFVDQ